MVATRVISPRPRSGARINNERSRPIVRWTRRPYQGRSPQALNGTPTIPRSNVRWKICALLFFGVTINYIDRNVLGILKPTLTADLGWSERDYANIVIAFTFAYAFGNLFGGTFMD